LAHIGFPDPNPAASGEMTLAEIGYRELTKDDEKEERANWGAPGPTMIFRSLERRRVRAAFGGFLDEKAIDKVMSEFSEWDCFISILPRWARSIFGRRLTDQQIAANIADFAQAALQEQRDRGNASEPN
jgi:hypothetical protein